MRVVMLTDDGSNIDRRILLEAESVADLGHEVIVIARNEKADGTVAKWIGRIKCLWIDYDLSYLAGSKDQLGLAEFTEGEGEFPPSLVAMPPPPPRPSVIKRLGAKLYRGVERYYNRSRSRLSSGLVVWKEEQLGIRRRLRLGTGIVRAYVQKLGLGALFFAGRRSLDLYRRQKTKRIVATSAPASIGPDRFELNIWEQAVFHRAVYMDPDLIHVHDLPQLLPAVLAARELRVPLIYDAHEVYPEIATLTPEQQVELREKEKVLLPYCTAAITVNPYCARFMEERYGAAPFDIILNATLPSPGHVRGQSDDRLRKRLGLGANDRILMFQGWMADVGRGLCELVEAMAGVRPEVHLVMMGYGDIEMFEKLAAKAGVADRVHLLPPVPWDELVLWSAAADVGVIPYQPVDFNHKVCSPNKLFEFISAGLPILANDLPYLTEVIEGQGFGITRQMDTPASMSRAINEMFDPANRHIEHARLKLQADAERWEWPVQAEKLKAIYRRVSDSQVTVVAAPTTQQQSRQPSV